MKYNVATDDEGYVVLIRHTGSPRDFLEISDIDLYDFEDGKLNAYYLDQTGLHFDQDRYNQILAKQQSEENEKEIAVLEDRLNKTDYISTKQVDKIMTLASMAMASSQAILPQQITDQEALNFIKDLMVELNNAATEYSEELEVRSEDRTDINNLRQTI